VGGSYTYTIPIGSDSDADVEFELKIVSTNAGGSARSRYLAVFSPTRSGTGNVTYSEVTDKRVIVANAQVSVTAAASTTNLAVTVANGTYTSALAVVAKITRGARAPAITAPSAPAIVLPSSPSFLWVKQQGLVTSGANFTSWTDLVAGAVLSFDGAPTANATGVTLAGTPDVLKSTNASLIAVANGNALHWSFVAKLTIVAGQGSIHSVLGWGKTAATAKSVWFATYVTSAEQDLDWSGESAGGALTGSVTPTVSTPIYIAARFDGTQTLHYINGAWRTITTTTVGNQTGIDIFNVGGINVAGVNKYFMAAKYEYVAVYNSSLSTTALEADIAALTELG
jgi:hypothetical protein